MQMDTKNHLITLPGFGIFIDATARIMKTTVHDSVMML